MYVYVLKSEKYNWYYVGLSGEIDLRILAHNNGWVKKARFYRPFRLVHVELAETRTKARALEKYFKGGYGKEIIREIEGNITA